jgi:hypothetical protein
VTPVIGARTTGVSMRTGPMEMGESRGISRREIRAKPLAGKARLG